MIRCAQLGIGLVLRNLDICWSAIDMILPYSGMEWLGNRQSRGAERGSSLAGLDCGPPVDLKNIRFCDCGVL